MSDELSQPTRETGAERPGFGDNYLRGLHASARGNAAAYGYSVTITASFGLLSVATGTPTAPEIFAFAGGAVLAFAAVGAWVSGGSGMVSGMNRAKCKPWAAPLAWSPSAWHSCRRWPPARS